MNRTSVYSRRGLLGLFAATGGALLAGCERKQAAITAADGPAASQSPAKGANAVPMAFAEVFTALEIKAIDGQENPLVHMYSNKMQEVQKYISLSNHVYTPVALVVSKKFWDGLSAADKEGIQKAADEAKLLQRQLLDEGDKDVIKKFGDAGVKVDSVPPAELTKIQDKVKPVVTKFAPQIGEEFIKEFYAEIDKARAAK